MLTRCNEVFDFAGVELEFYIDEFQSFWLHGATLCDILQLSNPTETIQRYVDEDWRSKEQADDKKGRKSWFIREPGFYQLSFASDNKSAKRFQRWVFEEVLPSIRRSRVYISPDATSADIISAAQDRGISLALELNDQQALLTYNAQLQNRCVDFDGLEQEWLSVSQILEKRGYKLKSKAVDVSLSQIGKTVKKDYIEATGKEPKLTVKQVGQNHGTEIKSYPADWYDRIEQTAITYWTKKGLIDLVK
jgi:prophage antirepressor-like protein